jgi:glycosyltransferase involved in cell wall biosynthesis
LERDGLPSTHQLQITSARAAPPAALLMRVSCVIGTRNQSSYIRECIESCLALTLPRECVLEVHLADCGSTDNTLTIAREYGERIHVHEWENAGQSAVFDFAGTLSTDVVMFCDGDDRLAPNRLTRLVSLFRAHDDVVLVGHSISEIDGAGELIRTVGVAQDELLDARRDGEGKRLYALRALLGTSRMAVRVHALRRVLPFRKIVLFEADEYVFSTLPLLGRTAVLRDVLTDYRLHEHNNYQNRIPTLERSRRFAEVHEVLLEELVQAYEQLSIGHFRYAQICERKLRKVCSQARAVESGLGSRLAALRVFWSHPSALGIVKRDFFRTPLHMVGILFLGLSRYDRLRNRFRAKRASRSRVVHL